MFGFRTLNGNLWKFNLLIMLDNRVDVEIFASKEQQLMIYPNNMIEIGISSDWWMTATNKTYNIIDDTCALMATQRQNHIHTQTHNTYGKSEHNVTHTNQPANYNQWQHLIYYISWYLKTIHLTINVDIWAMVIVNTTQWPYCIQQ